MVSVRTVAESGDGVGMEGREALHATGNDSSSQPHMQDMQGTTAMLQVTAGISRKVGLPNYSSAAATCSITAECDSALLEDPARMQRFIQRVYRRCEAAVSAELQRQVRRALPDGKSSVATRVRPSSATPRQIIAMRMLARRLGIELGDWLREQAIGAHEERLSRQQASQVIRLLGQRACRVDGSLRETPDDEPKRAVAAGQD